MKNIEWLEGDKKESEYHLKQYDDIKEYTKYILNFIKQENLILKSDVILDIGCGGGC